MSSQVTFDVTLLDDGTAFFGQANSGGRITINGDNGTISGGNGGTSTNGMTITLANIGVSGTTKAINVGNGKFYVNYDGTLYFGVEKGTALQKRYKHDEWYIYWSNCPRLEWDDMLVMYHK